jgi:hypothetical protein
MFRRRSGSTQPHPSHIQRDSLGAVALGLLLATLYALTLARTVDWYDSAEFASSAASLRVVPHPPGYPLYTLVAHVFTWLPGEPALGVNIMSATFGVAGPLLLYALALRMNIDRASAWTAAAIFGVCPTWWSNSVVAEVYTPGLTWGLGALYLTHKAMTDRSLWAAYSAAFLGGTGLGMHMSVATMGLGYLVFLGYAAVERGGERVGFDARFAAKMLAGCLFFALLGASVLLLVVVGPFEEVAPLGPRPTTEERMWDTFRHNVRGGIFRGYFKDFEWIPRLTTIGRIFIDNLTVIGAALGTGGLIACARRTAVRLALVALIVGNIGWFFRYDVPDLDVFLLPSLAAVTLGIAFSASRLRSFVLERWRPAATAFSLALAALPLSIAISTYPTVDASKDRSALKYAVAACADLPQDAIVAMTSRPDEWRRYTVLFYMHETGQECTDVEFWGSAKVRMINEALARGRRVFSFVPNPRFGKAFRIEKHGKVYEIEHPGRGDVGSG